MFSKHLLRRGKLKNNKIEDSGRIHHFSILQNTPGPRNTAKAESNPLEDFSLLMQYELLKTLIVQHTNQNIESFHYLRIISNRYFQFIYLKLIKHTIKVCLQ